MKSWVQYPEETDFPIQNLPFGVFKKVDQDAAQNRIGVAIGDFVLDLAALVDAGLFNGSEHLGNGECFKKDYLNDFMAMGKAARVEARNIISKKSLPFIFLILTCL